MNRREALKTMAAVPCMVPFRVGCEFPLKEREEPLLVFTLTDKAEDMLLRGELRLDKASLQRAITEVEEQYGIKIPHIFLLGMKAEVC